MSKSEEIRRQLGCDMIREEQQYAALHPDKRPKQPEKAPEPKAETVEDALLRDIVIQFAQNLAAIYDLPKVGPIGSILPLGAEMCREDLFRGKHG